MGRTMRSFTHSKQRSAMRGFACAMSPPLAWLRWCGRIKNPSINEIDKVINSTIGMNFNTCPNCPDKNINGPKTHAVVRKEAATPGKTSIVPLAAASSGGALRRHLSMFSAMTMLSSIIRPTAIKSAIRLIMLMVIPNTLMTYKLPKNETGSAADIHNASRSEKNSHIVIKTRIKPITIFSTIRSMRCSTSSEKLLITATSKGSGYAARSASNMASTRSKTRILSSSVDLEIEMMAVCTPSIKLWVFSSLSTNVTVATSDKRATAPSLVSITMRSSRSATVRVAPEYRKTTSPSAKLALPKGC